MPTATRLVCLLWSPIVIFLASCAFAQDTGREIAGDYWAYCPVGRPVAPVVQNDSWVANPIDAFILAKLEENGLTPAPPASKETLIRRAYYDLTGLPPTPDAVDAFLNNTSPNAYEELIDRLLASPRYGEKWGRHWLDLVRYAETKGYEDDWDKPFAWRYRDYVIDAFNRDKPYDQFIKEQIAGDEMDVVTSETIIATGYQRLGIWDIGPADAKLQRYDYLDDIVSTTGQVILGMTIGCARCHDHKIDPISTKDYYSLLAFFHDITLPGIKGNPGEPLVDIGPPEQLAEHQKRLAERESIVEKLADEVFKTEQRLKAEFAKIQPKPTPPYQLQGVLIPVDDWNDSSIADLTYRVYRGMWKQAPKSFEGLKYETMGLLSGGAFSLTPAVGRVRNVALVFEGTLQAPADGKYTFRLKARGSYRLIVNHEKLLEADEARGRHQEESVNLKKGAVPIRLEFFNRYSETPLLEASWSGPNFENQALSTAITLIPDCRLEGQDWIYTLEQPTENWMKPGFDASGWKLGVGAFGNEETPGTYVRTEWNSSDIWLRREFVLDTVPHGLSLSLYHDGEVVVFINGKRAGRIRGSSTAYQTVRLNRNKLKDLKPGRNLIAIHCQNNGGGHYIDVGLIQKRSTNDIKDPGLFDNLVLLAREEGIEETESLLELRRKYRMLSEQLDEIRKKPIPYEHRALAVAERGHTPTHVLVRGNPHLVGRKVEPAFPTVLQPLAAIIPAARENAKSSGKRRVLAEWIASRENPLTARVMVNRIWQHHFGRGIVRSSNDFGKLGTPPTHPQLLDWLAQEMIASGWRLKAMHKLIMTSNSYRMSAQGNSQARLKDPSNNLFCRFNRRRLGAEEIRDAVLWATGKLNFKMGGPSVFAELPEAVLATASAPDKVWGESPPEEANRRSIYLKVKRSMLVPILNQFDLPNTDSTCPVRFSTTVPTQSLTTLNGKFINDQALAFANRMRWEGGVTAEDQVRFGLRLVLCREPDLEEVVQALQFMQELQNEEGVKPDVALDRFALLALNLNEFIFLD